MAEVNRGSVWKLNNPEKDLINRKSYYKKNRQIIIKRNAEWLKNNPEYALWHRAKQRALRSGLDFDINKEDVVIPDSCPLIEVPLVWGHGEYSPALDRIDNEKGYIKGNIQVISHLANRMKNNATLDQLNNFCKNWMMNHRPDMDDRWKEKKE